MKKRIKKVGRIFLLLLCMAVGSSCSPGREMADAETKQELEQDTLPEETGAEQMKIQEEGVLDMTEMEEVFSPEVQSKKNEALFFEEAKKQKIGIKPAEELYGRLLEDQVFQNGFIALTDLRIDDIDGNGLRGSWRYL